MITQPRRTLGVATLGALLVSVTAGAAAAIAAAAEHVADSTVMSASDTAAVLLLARAVRAQRERNYSGTEYVSAWSDGSATSSVVNIEHTASHGTLVQVEPSVSTPGRAVQEPDQDDQPTSIDPLAVSAVDGGPLDLLRRNFILTVAAADRTVSQVQARRTDGTLAAEFWLDRRTSLPVRREIFDDKGRLVRASAFVNLHVNIAPTMTTTAAPIVVSAPPDLPVTGTDVAAMRQAGWVLPAQLPGGMVLYDVRRQGTGEDQVVHLSYSDGLSTVSVFVQSGKLAKHSVQRWSRTRMGGPVYVRGEGFGSRVTWNGHGRVYTVVADAPPNAVAAVVASLPHGESHRGFWSRLWHGLARVGSWFNPFG
ncbi:MAG: MucB/RseB C-terminal domain-containing protein [Actinomycetes bacterium]